MSPEEPTNAELGWRLGTLEDMVKAAVARLEAKVDSAVARLEGKVESLTYVRTDVYESDKKAQERLIDNQNERIDGIAKVSWWALGLVVGTTITIMVGGLVRLAAS